MSAARDLLADLAGIGATIEPAGDRIILRAGPTAIPADLVGRIRHAKAELLATLVTHPVSADRSGADLIAPSGWFQRIASPADGEPGFGKPCAARRGRVDQQHGVLLHFCATCGAWGAYGYGVNVRAGRLGRWYCAAHRPRGELR